MATLRSVILLAAFGCATATADRMQQPVTITIRESTIPYDSAVGPANFDVTVVARNDGRIPIYFSPMCVWETQRLMGKEWTKVDAPTCPGTDFFEKLAPGDSAVFPITISDPTTGARDADPQALKGRVYRLLFGVGLGKNPTNYLSDRSVYVPVTSSTVVVKE